MSTREWWVNGVGENLLRGVEGDPSNPVRLADHFIVDFLRRYEAARLSFNRLFPLLSPLEQTRLAELTRQAQYMYIPEQFEVDAVQRKHNRAGIHTTGPKGGLRAQRVVP
jgi:hypothetical protein